MHEDNQVEEGLLDGEKLRKRMELLLPQAKKEVVVISAYVTQSAVEWLASHIPDRVSVELVCRLLPSDIINGSTHISALQTALDNGMHVLCLHSLHAKIYAIDSETIYVGSANLTNNGLKIYGTGNLEVSSRALASKENIDFLKKIVASATPIDKEALQRMESCINIQKNNLFFDQWPEGILKEREGIWVRDFFWSLPGASENSIEKIHDLELLGFNSNMDIKNIQEKHLLQTRCVKWLVKKLDSAPNKELYFGAITKLLHDDLKDDPSPYRKDVKSLVQNLIAYAQSYLSETIEVTTPRHSQRVRLILN